MANLILDGIVAFFAWLIAALAPAAAPPSAAPPSAAPTEPPAAAVATAPSHRERAFAELHGDMERAAEHWRFEVVELNQAGMADAARASAENLRYALLRR